MTTSARIMVAIASNQVLPNFMPAVLRRPDQVILLRSDNDSAIRRHTDRVKEALESAGIPTRILTGMPASDYAAMVRFLSNVKVRLESEWSQAEYELNITGGTKVMALAVVATLGTTPGSSVIYVDTAAGHIEVLQGADRRPQPLDDALELRPLLKLHGFTVESIASENDAWRESVMARESLTKTIAKSAFADSGKAVIRDMIMSAILSPERGADFRLHRSPRGAWEDILKKAKRLGLVEWDGARSLSFTSEAAADYFKGLWLEEYLWLGLRDQPGLQVFCSVKGFWGKDTEQSGLRDRGYNELDILVLKNNRLVVVECKTGEMSKSTTRVTEVLAKLNAMARACGGTMADALLVTFQELKVGDIERAKELNVRVYQGSHIRHSIRNIVGKESVADTQRKDVSPGLY